MLYHIYGNEAVSCVRCFEWHAFFKSGRTSLEDDKRSAQPSMSSTLENVEIVRRLAHEGSEI